jgi:hypothetical protein
VTPTKSGSKVEWRGMYPNDPTRCFAQVEPGLANEFKALSITPLIKEPHYRGSRPHNLSDTWRFVTGRAACRQDGTVTRQEIGTKLWTATQRLLFVSGLSMLSIYGRLACTQAWLAALRC